MLFLIMKPVRVKLFRLIYHNIRRATKNGKTVISKEVTAALNSVSKKWQLSDLEKFFNLTADIIPVRICG